MKTETQKQAISFTIIHYFGIIIGIFSTLFIYPKNKEMLGVFRYVESLSQILFPIMLIGASQALVNFSPKLNGISKKLLFNYSVISILIVASFLSVLVYGLSFFSGLKAMKYIYFALPIGFFLAFVELFKKQASILQKTAIPALFDAVLPKVALPVIFVLLLSQCVSIYQSLLLYVLSFGLLFVFSTLYLNYYFRPKFTFLFSDLFEKLPKKEYYQFSLFAFAGSLGSVFAFRIDAIMIPKLISMQANGTFSIGLTLASALAIPATGIFAIYAPIVSNYLKTNSFDLLELKYKETAKLLFCIGALLYSCVFLGIENLFELLPTHQNLLASVPVILILGLTVLINMGTGFNGEIITYSKHYRFNLVAILVLIVLNIGLNLLFILRFELGIVGAAFASLISMMVFNGAKLWFIFKKFKMLPFDCAYFKLILVVVVCLFLVYFLPDFGNNIFNLIFKTALSLSLNLFLIYRLKLVFQVNFFIDKWLDLFKKKIRSF